MTTPGFFYALDALDTGAPTWYKVGMTIRDPLVSLSSVPSRAGFAGSYDPFMTQAQEERGYPLAAELLRGYDTVRLAREYLQAQGNSLGQMFGHNAKKAMKLLASELLARGVVEIPNIFGPIPVVHPAAS